jgi:trehalose 6-phosphate phosphatase
LHRSSSAPSRRTFGLRSRRCSAASAGAVAYAGAHGAELLSPGAKRPKLIPAFASWEGRVRDFAAGHDDARLRKARVRIEDKGPIFAFHWRGAPDEDAARTIVEGIAQEAEAAGFVTHWGRLVLEIRPPVPVDKGMAVRELLAGTQVEAALYGGDDATDVDAFEALESLRADRRLDGIVRVGVRSDEGPAAIVEQADLVVEGVAGFARVLEALAAA